MGEDEDDREQSVHRFVGPAFIYGGPAGLLVAIVLSLWVSYLHTRFTVAVHVETAWVSGESLAFRAQWLAERPTPIEGARASLWVSQGDRRLDLGDVRSTPRDGLVQGTFVVPKLAEGAAELHLRLSAEGIDTREEVIPVNVVRTRPVQTPTPLVSGSNLQHGDDSEPQPPGIRIDVRPAGRWLTQFTNTAYVRVMSPEGAPYQGPVEVLLASGEFMGKRGKSEDPASLVRGTTDALGLLDLTGPLTSEVVRLEVRVLEREDPKQIRFRRRVYLVTHAGGVQVETGSNMVAPGPVALEVRGQSFSRKRPVFVDVHGPDGAWMGTLEPPFVGAEPPRPWNAEAVPEGLLQFEAYHFTNSPGASTAVARVLVDAADPRSHASLEPLFAAHRDALALARVDATYDSKVEALYLAHLGQRTWSGPEIARAREFLLETLPVGVYGPPSALMTRERDHAEMAAFKARWTMGLRWFLLGGGALFLAAMTAVMVANHARAARATLAVLETSGEPTGPDAPEAPEAPEAMDPRRAARVAARAALARGFGIIAIMAGGLVLTAVMLESLLWVF